MADLSQAEIDHIFATINNASSDPNQTSADDAEAARLHYERHGVIYKQLVSALKRYDHALRHGASHGEIRELRRAYHHYSFKNWLMHRWMDKDQYYTLIRKEMKKRGMR